MDSIMFGISLSGSKHNVVWSPSPIVSGHVAATGPTVHICCHSGATSSRGAPIKHVPYQTPTNPSAILPTKTTLLPLSSPQRTPPPFAGPHLTLSLSDVAIPINRHEAFAPSAATESARGLNLSHSQLALLANLFIYSIKFPIQPHTSPPIIFPPFHPFAADLA
ncbi:hypothetical protein SDJN03_11084, partial [Cucurbita argyrosperma subsp. sororia]